MCTEPGLREVRPMKGLFACAALLAGSLIMMRQALADEVKVWQGTVTLPTYEEGVPDPNPPFDAYSTRQFSYPYTLRTSLTGQKKSQLWRALFLENQYLECTVLPDIGGHIYTCVDKVSGQPIFYANPSIKKAQIGYRGAWAAFGVEFNFPVSHNWVSMSPVDFSFAPHPDGSASITVGNIDRVYGMQWIVELVLRPASMLLEEKVTLYNRSDVRHRYYWWNNAGIEVWDDSQVEYPMRYAASHGFTDVYSWPIGPEGKDLSVIRNQTDGPVSFFVHGSHEPFMGIWNPKTQTGTVHYADYSDLPAKKIWSWGSDAEGLGWRKALSDNNSAYVEVQAGLFRNQETYAFLEPGQTIRFSEFWMPVRGIGGISRANKTGVVSFRTHGSELQIALNVNQTIKKAHIRILQSDSEVWSESVDLLPEKVWAHSVRGNSAKTSFELSNEEGKVLLHHKDGEYDWDPDSTIEIGHQPVYEIPKPDARTEDEWLKEGTDQELNGKTILAMETYLQSLQKYPQSLILKMSAGRLAASLQRFAEAQSLLRAVHQRETSNAEAAYYLGIAEEGLGHLREAQVDFEVGYHQAGFHARSAARIAELLARQGNLTAAQKFLKSAVEAAPFDLRAKEQLETVTRALGDTAGADQLAQHALAVDPTSDVLKEDTGTPDLPHLAEDPYRVLRIATHFMEIGLYRTALSVLERRYPDVPPNQTEPGALLPQNHPLVVYYVAFCRAKLGQNTEKYSLQAQQLFTNLVFPSTPMDRAVLEAALSANSNDGTAHYLLGTLLFSKGLYDQALEHWEQAKRLSPKMPVLDADLGKALLHIKNDPRSSLKFFRSGLEDDPTNPEIYAGLDEAMSLDGASAQERAATLSRFPSTGEDSSKAAMPANLVYQLALTRAEAGQFDSALGLFKDRFFPSEEGGVSSNQVFLEIGLMQAEAEAKAGKCREAEELLNHNQGRALTNVASSQTYLRMAGVATTCKQAEETSLLTKAASRKSSADSAWATTARKLLGTSNPPEDQKTLIESLAEAERMTETSSFTGWWWYNKGVIEAILHRREQAESSFRTALLLPDSLMSHHYSRVALANLDADKTGR